MKTIECRIPYRCSFLLIILALCVPAIAQAEISVTGNWDASGELALEGENWRAVFSKEEGALSVYSESRETMKIVPFFSEKAQEILSCEAKKVGEEQMEVSASFSDGQSQIDGSFLFHQEGAIQVKPSQNMAGILIFGEISFGVVPSPPLEDLIYDPVKYPAAANIHLPSENLFLGLLKGEDGVFFCAWPEGDQKVRLLMGDGEAGRTIEAVEIKLDGKDAYLKSVSAPGIWHREELLRTYLGKEIEIDWKRPFRAKWKTQLLEGEIETSFNFRTGKGRSWRPNFGFYEYPVWFDEEKALLHLGKKVPPKGQALIYAMEEHDDTPIVFARGRLGSIPTLKAKTGLRRYPVKNVGIQNCDGRAWVKWVFRMNRQTREREMLLEAMDDFIYSINTDKSRLDEYEAFIPEIKDKINLWLEKEKNNPELEPFLSEMKQRLEELEGEYWDKMHKSPASEHLKEETEVINQLKVLIEEEGVEVYPKTCHLLDKIQLWSDIEAVPGRVGGLFREMFQKAGYGCAQNAGVVKYAEEIRKDIREFMITGETHETVY